MFKITDECIMCGCCVSDCPMEAISDVGGKFVIDNDACMACGSCKDRCPAEAIVEE